MSSSRGLSLTLCNSLTSLPAHSAPTTSFRPQTTTSRAEVTTTTSRATPTSRTTAAPPAATAASSGPSASWKQKSIFGSLESFTQNVVQRWTWGQANTEVIQGIPASGWKSNNQRDSNSAIQVAYPAGSRNPSASPIGGVGFYSDKRECSSRPSNKLS